jgi:hypothetical protein
MTASFGPIVQNGYVVRDLAAAMDHWTQALGVGPFFVTSNVRFSEIVYRGRPSPIAMAVAVAYSGDLQIELIQAKSDAPSIYLDHLAAHGEGLQHVGVLPADYDAALARALAEGVRVAQSGRLESGLRFAYLDTEGTYPGCMVELIENTPGMQRFIEKLKARAREWDGGEPVRFL